ncbi:MAG: 4Fe-4S ferredoxin [Peptococcaceae bacterium BRH_c4b]|nr:MAG: 4Fe-4S ferredoxin [Peptococcaceae bacterium BRH_c4b]
MKRIFIKPELCAGCKNCQVACLAEHSPTSSVWLVNLSDQSSQPRNSVRLNDQNRPVPLTCRHCSEPECVTACMTGALSKDPVTGLVQHDPESCAGCWMCVMSCPFGMIAPKAGERKIAVKCDFCAGREMPRCVEACPTGAITLVEISPTHAVAAVPERSPEGGIQ